MKLGGTATCITCKTEFKYTRLPRKYCGKNCRWGVTSFDHDLSKGCRDLTELLNTEYERSYSVKARLLLIMIQFTKEKIPCSKWPKEIRKITGTAQADIVNFMKDLKRKYWYYY